MNLFYYATLFNIHKGALCLVRCFHSLLFCTMNVNVNLNSLIKMLAAICMVKASIDKI